MKTTVRSIRKGSVQWNEEDRLELVKLLAKCGYATIITRQRVPGTKNGQMEYVVKFWEDDDAIHNN